MGMMKIISGADKPDNWKEEWEWTPGDTKISWNPDIDKEVEVAKDKFDAMIKKGFTAFRVDSKGEKTSERVYEFIPYAEKLILVPPSEGGQ